MSILKPDCSLLCKLGSIAVHLEEYTGDNGVDLDLMAAVAIIDDPEIQEWIEGMNKMVLLPLKRGRRLK